jgi:hypothetical protein
MIYSSSHVAHLGEIRNMDRILVECPEGFRLRGRHRHRLEDNIKMDVGWMCVCVLDLSSSH